jgi:hypothetical protein
LFHYFILISFAMKLRCIFLILIALSLTTYGQNVGIGTSSPNALLDVSATNNGILVPRVALTGTGSASPLTSPATSTLVYNTATVSNVTPGFYYWNGSAWVRVIDNASLTGATTVSNTSSVNTLSTTVNGVTGTGVNIITGHTLSMSGNTLTSTVNGIAPAQSLSGLSLSGDVTGTLAGSTVGQIQGKPVSATAPTAGQVLEYVGSTWTPTSPTLGTVTSIATTAPITGGTITGSGTIGISQANTSTNGYLSSADWNTFNNKQGTISLTTTGSSGAATFSSNTLNIPNYTLAGLGGQPTLTAGNGITISSNTISANLWTASSTNIYNANSGNVGIGTASPLALLSIGAGSLSDANLPVQMSTGGTGTQAWYAVNKNGAYGLLMGYSNGALGTQAIIRQVTTDPLAFYVNNTLQAVTILSSGYVGIGTATPTALLDVTGAVAADTKLHLLNTSTGNSGLELRASGAASQQYIDFANSSTSNVGSGTPDYTNRIISNSGSLTFNTSGLGNALVLLNGGNVGIGVASPAYKLDAAGSARFNTGGGSYVYVGPGGGAYYGDAANMVVNMPAGGAFYMANVGTAGTNVAQATGTLTVGGPGQTTANIIGYGNCEALFGPNSSWGNYLRVGGNNGGGSDANASICTTNGNMHIDASSIGPGTQMYLNYYKGNGVYVMNGQANGGFGQLYTGTLNVGGSGQAAANIIGYGDCAAIFGPNSSWGNYLRIGGNNGGSSDANASVCTTNGNLHLDASSVGPGKQMYLNYYKGSGVYIMNGLANGGYGVIYAATFSVQSDKRLKEDIETLPNNLDMVRRLRPVSYHFKEPNKELGRQIGFIAQEVQQVFPELVTLNAQGYYGVNYSALIAPVTGAVQELDAKVAELEKQNAQLQSRNTELNEKINALSSTADEVNILKVQLQELKSLMEKNGIRGEK